jgi:hypothetical protein
LDMSRVDLAFRGCCGAAVSFAMLTSRFWE